MSPSLIQFNNLLPNYIDPVLADASQVWLKQISFRAGQNYQIVAPSGKGKSTLISIIYGLNNQYTGEVTFDNSPISTIKEQNWADLRVNTFSIVFQDLKVFGDLSMLENLKLRCYLNPNYKPNLNLMAEMLGMADKLNKKVKLLSQGERQRVALIRALSVPFKWLLLDEPFSNLDDDTAKFAIGLIGDKCAEFGASIIINSLNERQLNVLNTQTILL